MRVLLVLFATGCVLTRPPRDEERPRWHFNEQVTFDTGCGLFTGFIRKSGKQGIGIALQLKSRESCEITLANARLEFSDGTRIPVTAPPPVALRGRSLVYRWWPVRFDNNAVWNAHRDAADLVFEYVSQNTPVTGRFPMSQR